ncbi:MAG: DUF624 domain-containing protein [Eubacterium sp.]|nr:DUF624 domain-containing protein [Eubacterium sp.]MCM1344681.1 DUF624 domain-containing protein [Muribaculaceae bacterium]MCM1409460.1 DUF624 domain-containing protein [Lachnospiraceae bacterium]
MGSIFNLDSPVMQALGKVADLMWLNILTMICCIPIITIGPSLTAMHYMALKIVRNEECYITRGFFKSFKENFLQGMVIGILTLFVLLVLIGDFVLLRNPDLGFSKYLQILITIIAVLFLFTVLYVYPVLAKFANTIFRTIKNAFLMSILQFPKTLLMIVIWALPGLLLFISGRTVPIVFLFGLSGPAWLCAHLYNKFFKKLEDQILAENPPEEVPNDDEHIFSDVVNENPVSEEQTQE